MKRILWISRHEPLESQRKYLQGAFGEDCTISRDSNPFSSAEEVVKRAKDYDEMVLIAPLSVVRKVVELGIKPLWSEMEPATKETSEVQVQGRRERIQNKARYYKFIKFRRVESVKLEFSELNY